MAEKFLIIQSIPTGLYNTAVAVTSKNGGNLLICLTFLYFQMFMFLGYVAPTMICTSTGRLPLAFIVESNITLRSVNLSRANRSNEQTFLALACGHH